jgi:hypothetical protein
MNRITIVFIPEDEMRYRTDGDWQFGSDGSLEIRVNSTLPEDEQWAVTLHKLAEALLCRQRGITQEVVDAWNLEWEQWERVGEPGENRRAPYHREHMFASALETLFTLALEEK